MHKFKIFFSAVNLLILSILMGGGRSYASSTRHCYTINYPVNVSEVRVGFADNRQTTDSIAALLRQVENYYCCPIKIEDSTKAWLNC